ncbi:MAG: glycosyltransferase, partial [Thiotrichaceae bacterium]
MSLVISVVMPIFDCESTIERTLKSLAAQDYPHLEIILMDGKSRDHTMKIVKRYKSLFTHMISEADEGQTDALNKGFRLATGDIYCWLNGDDTFEEGALKHVVELFKANPNKNMVIGTSHRIYADDSEEIIP